MRLIAYKYRMYPNAAQKEYFRVNFDAVRFTWNKLLEAAMTSWKESGKFCIPYPSSLKTTHIWLKEADSLALANVQIFLKASWIRFCKMEKHWYRPSAKKKAQRQNRELAEYDLDGHPKFKSRKDTRRQSYTTNNQYGTVAIIDSHVRLPKIGLVRCKFHRQALEGALVKSATVSMTACGEYYVSILMEKPWDVDPVSPSTFLGLDFSMGELYVDHNGDSPDYPKWYRKTEKKLAREQRRLNLMQKESKNYLKQRDKIAVIHEKIACQRKDFLHKHSASIAKKHDAVCMETLNMADMAQALNFGKSVMDAGWGMFSRFLTYKQQWRGHHVIRIGKWFPSTKLCSVCGMRGEVKLGQRQWICGACGTSHARDHNAAVNIRNEGMRLFFENFESTAGQRGKSPFMLDPVIIEREAPTSTPCWA